MPVCHGRGAGRGLPGGQDQKDIRAHSDADSSQAPQGGIHVKKTFHPFAEPIAEIEIQDHRKKAGSGKRNGRAETFSGEKEQEEFVRAGRVVFPDADETPQDVSESRSFWNARKIAVAFRQEATQSVADSQSRGEP